MKINVRYTLDKPKKEKETLNILCIDKFENYHINDVDGYNTADITEVVAWITKKIMSLGHDGTMQIDLTRYIWHETKEEDFEEFFKEQIEAKKNN